MSNQIRVIKEIDEQLRMTEKSLITIDEAILRISKNARTASDNFKKIKVPKDVDDTVKKTRQETEKLNPLLKEQKRLENELSKQVAKRKLATGEVNKELIKNRTETQKINQSVKEAAKLSSTLSSEYEKQQIRLNRLVRRQRELRIQQELGNKLSKAQVRELKRLDKQILKLDTAFKKVDASSGRFQRNVGNYPKGLLAAANAARNLASAMGLVGGAFLIVNTIRDAIGVIRSFEKQNATLAGILGVTTDKTIELRKEAIKYGESTVKTASEVAGLQIAYARLGFSQEQIINLTEATIEGSIALNSSLDETASLVGAVVNSYTNLNDTDAQEIIDKLTLSTTRSALSFEKLSTAIPISAGAANALGVPFSTLLALLGKLADAGIDTSTASTALRNIFIESAATGVDYRKTLQDIANSQDKLTAANVAFGKRAAVSAVILANNIDQVNDLDKALNNASGTAAKLAANELNTLDGSLKLLESAWQGVILGTNDTIDASNVLRDVIKTLANNLKSILNVIGFGIASWAAYKLAVLAATLQTKLMNLQLVNSRKASLAAAKGISKTTLVFSNFNKVLKANALGIAITAVIALASAFEGFSQTLSESNEEIIKSNVAIESQAKSLFETNKEIDSLLLTYNELKNSSKDNKEEQEKLNAVIQKLAETVPGAVTKFDEYGNALEINEEKIKSFTKSNSRLAGQLAESQLKDQEQALKDTTKEIERITKAQEDSNSQFIKGFGRIGFLNGELVKYTSNVGLSGQTTETVTKLTADEILQLREKQKQLSEQREELEKNIASNKEIILNSKGLLSERQKEAKQVEENNKKLAEEQKNLDANTLLIPKLREEIRLLNIERAKIKQGGLTVAEEDEFKRINDEIKLRKNRIKAILGEKEAKEKIDKQFAKTTLKTNEDVFKSQKKLADATLKVFKDLNGIDNKIEIPEIDQDSINRFQTRIARMLIDSYNTEAIKENVNDALGRLTGEIEKFSGISANSIMGLFKTIQTTGARTFESVGSIALQSFDIITQASSAVSQGRIQALDLELERNNEYYDNLLENENLTESERERLENDRQLKEDQIRAKQRQEQVKQARFEKAFNIASIITNTAVGVSKALAQGGFILGLPQAAVIAGLGAAQLALAIAQPIPQFAEGKNFNDNYEGPAIWGEKQREVKLSSNGKIEVSPNKIGNHLTHVKKDDVIFPSIGKAESYLSTLSDNDLINDLNKHVYLSNMHNNSLISSQYLANKEIIKSSKEGAKEIVKAINAQKTRFNLHNNISIEKDLKYLFRSKNII